VGLERGRLGPFGVVGQGDGELDAVAAVDLEWHLDGDGDGQLRGDELLVVGDEAASGEAFGGGAEGGHGVGEIEADRGFAGGVGADLRVPVDGFSEVDAWAVVGLGVVGHGEGADGGVDDLRYGDDVPIPIAAAPVVFVDLLELPGPEAAGLRVHGLAGHLHLHAHGGLGLHSLGHDGLHERHVYSRQRRRLWQVVPRRHGCGHVLRDGALLFRHTGHVRHWSALGGAADHEGQGEDEQTETVWARRRGNGIVVHDRLQRWASRRQNPTSQRTVSPCGVVRLDVGGNGVRGRSLQQLWRKVGCE